MFENSAIVVFVSSPLTNCCVTSVNHEFGATMARLNQSRVSAVSQSNLIAIKSGTAKARRLSWA